VVSLSLEPIPSDSSTIAEALKLSTSIFDNVLLSASKVLFVNVSVVARPTKVSVDVGKVRVPVLDIELITGVVSVLFVRVCEPVKVLYLILVTLLYQHQQIL
jgi:hypothetical protein